MADDLAQTMIVTRESLAAEYDQVIAGAHREKQYAAAASAIAAKQKLLGFDPAQRNLNVNLTGSFNGLTDDELAFEFASMINEARASAGKAPIALPAPKEKKH